MCVRACVCVCSGGGGGGAGGRGSLVGAEQPVPPGEEVAVVVHEAPVVHVVVPRRAWPARRVRPWVGEQRGAQDAAGGMGLRLRKARACGRACGRACVRACGRAAHRSPAGGRAGPTDASARCRAPPPPPPTPPKVSRKAAPRRGELLAAEGRGGRASDHLWIRVSQEE